MAEYIKREELHCSNCCICSFKEELCDCNSEFAERYKCIGGAEDFIKAVLKTSIVHCEECKYWRPHTQHGYDEDYDEYHNYCAFHMPDDEWYAEYWDANDYCSYGERKDD